MGHGVSVTNQTNSLELEFDTWEVFKSETGVPGFELVRPRLQDVFGTEILVIEEQDE